MQVLKKDVLSFVVRDLKGRCLTVQEAVGGGTQLTLLVLCRPFGDVLTQQSIFRLQQRLQDLMELGVSVLLITTYTPEKARLYQVKF